MLVRDRGLLYYRLLKSNVEEAKRVVCGGQKIISQFTAPPKAVSTKIIACVCIIHFYFLLSPPTFTSLPPPHFLLFLLLLFLLLLFLLLLFLFLLLLLLFLLLLLLLILFLFPSAVSV